MHALAERGEVARRREALAKAARDPAMQWDLSGVEALDAIGAHLLLTAWGGQQPASLQLTEGQRDTFEMVASNTDVTRAPESRESWAWLRALGDRWHDLALHGRDLLVLSGSTVLQLGSAIVRPSRAPWREISAQIFHTGTQALGITALVGFLIGVVLSYLSAQQLKLFGASVYIVNLLGVSVVRELGPVLAAILVAGRSGSAITAQIGVMRVTQELDALQVLGISHTQRLVLPRVIALAISMPLLVLWTDAMALAGGMVVAYVDLGLSPTWFLTSLQSAVSYANLWIGLGKGVLFGMLVALVGCHFGLRVEPNTESLGRGTTASVVTSITGVILVDALCAVIFSEIGL